MNSSLANLFAVAAGAATGDAHNVRENAQKVMEIAETIEWLSQHQRFAKFGVVMGEYIMRYALSTCLSEGACAQCERCLHFLGLHIDSVGVGHVISSAAGCAYSEAMNNPSFIMNGLRGIIYEFQKLANMPEDAAPQHRQLAAEILRKNSDWNSVMAKADSLYAANASWVKVALPEILLDVKNVTTDIAGTARQTAVDVEQKVANIVSNSYKAWRNKAIANAEDANAVAASMANDDTTKGKNSHDAAAPPKNKKDNDAAAKTPTIAEGLAVTAVKKPADTP